MKLMQCLRSAAILLLTPVFVHAMDLSEFQEHTRIMQQCTLIANQIRSTPVPAGHEAARRSIATNKLLARTGNTSQLIPVDPIHINYSNWITTASNTLSECSKKHAVAIGKLQDRIATLENEKQPEPNEIPAVQQAFTEWVNAQKELANAIVGLFENRTIQSYTHGGLQGTIVRAPVESK